MTQYRVSTIKLEELKSKLDVLDRRAKKLDMEWVYRIHVHPEPEVLSKDGFSINIWTIEVDGQPLMLKGWRLIAKLDHMPGGDTLIKRVPGVDLEIPIKFRTSGPFCGHCGTNRYRVKTYLVAGKDGTIKQVGSSCLMDFTGHKSPEALAALADAMSDLANGLDEAQEYDPFTDFDFHFDKFNIHLATFLSYVAKEVEESGWMSRGRAPRPGTATADLAYSGMAAKQKTPLDFPTEKHYTTVEKWLAWIRDELAQKDALAMSDFEHNLVVVCKGDRIKYDDTGLAAAIAYAYQKEHKPAPNGNGATSQHVGHIKERLEFSHLHLLAILPTTGGRFGPSYKHTFEDQNGNTVVWWTGKRLGETGTFWSGKGTIKKHGTWQGVKETSVTRCKLVEVGPPPARLL